MTLRSIAAVAGGSGRCAAACFTAGTRCMHCLPSDCALSGRPRLHEVFSALSPQLRDEVDVEHIRPGDRVTVARADLPLAG
jgi:hypothetical protein